MDVLAYGSISLIMAIGVLGVLTQKDLIKITIALNVMEAGFLLLFVYIATRLGGSFPIIRSEAATYVDPLPQALVLTAIVIGASTTAVLLALTVLIHNAYGTTNIDALRRLKG